MEKISLNKLRKETIGLVLLFVILVILFQTLFNKEQFAVILRTAFSLFWLFILPGFIFMYRWHAQFDFIERLIIGTVLGIAIMGTFGYNLGLLGIKINIQAFLLPIISLAIVGFIMYKKSTS